MVGLLAVVSGLLTGPRRLLGDVRISMGLSAIVGVAQVVITFVAGVGMLLLAAGLRRRKRRAWALASAISAPLTATAAVHAIGAGHGHWTGVLVPAVLLALLISSRRHFHANSDPGGTARAGAVLLQLAAAGVAIGWVLLALNPRRLDPGTSPADELVQALLALIGVSGPVAFAEHSEWLDDMTAAVGLSFGATAVLTAGYFLLRTPEPRPRIDADDERRLRELVRQSPDPDSLDYFALRHDKTVVFAPSCAAAVSYRVLAGVALASGDPLGERGEWTAAICAFLRLAAEHAWVPAVLGCSEDGATAWTRAGLSALEFGDEAVLDTASFRLDGRPMRQVRQAVARARRAEHTVTIRRVADLDPRERAALTTAVAHWRGGVGERGFSMALSRLADPCDGDAVLAVAHRDGTATGLLQLVPWAATGLSLDLMRRSPDAPPGLIEALITEVMAWAADHGVERVSLNFAVFRGALERGRRLGAGPVARLWAKILQRASRWWQIESLYRFNAKFHPRWVPRFVVYPTARDLPRVLLAVLEAEGFGGRPPAMLRLLHR